MYHVFLSRVSDTFCDPMGDYTVFSFSRLLNNSEPVENKSVIMASARVSIDQPIRTQLFQKHFLDLDVVKLQWVSYILSLAPSTLDARNEANWDTENPIEVTEVSTQHAPSNVCQNGTWLYFFALLFTSYPMQMGPW